MQEVVFTAPGAASYPALYPVSNPAPAAASKAAQAAGGDVDMEDMMAIPLRPRPQQATGPGVATPMGQDAITAVGRENHHPATAAKTGTRGSKPGAPAAAPPPAGPKPPLKDDFKGWVAHQKVAWRGAREQRKRRRIEAAAAARNLVRARGGAGGAEAPAAAVEVGGRSDLGRMLRQQAAAITGVSWQVLQVAKTVNPGRFKVCAVPLSVSLSLSLVLARSSKRGASNVPRGLRRV